MRHHEQEDCQIYPDMAAYHSIAVTLGQAGFLKELINVIDSMKMKPSKRPKNLWRRDWDPCLQPDVVIYNAVMNIYLESSLLDIWSIIHFYMTHPIFISRC